MRLSSTLSNHILKNFQWWRFYHTSGEVVHRNDCSHGKKFLFQIKTKPLPVKLYLLPLSLSMWLLLKRETLYIWMYKQMHATCKHRFFRLCLVGISMSETKKSNSKSTRNAMKSELQKIRSRQVTAKTYISGRFKLPKAEWRVESPCFLRKFLKINSHHII